MANARYPNLPRIELTTQDGFLIAVRDRPLTESVLIIGPALDGPNDRIIPLNNQADVEKIFGPAVFDRNYIGPEGQVGGFAGNDLIKAMREVGSGGCADIRLLRVGGAPATGIFTMPAQVNVGVTGTITFTSRFGGRIYNGVRVDFSSGAVSGVLTLSQPIVKGGNLSISWTQATSGLTVAQVIDLLNGHPLNRTVKASLGSISATAPARLLNGGMALTGAVDGTKLDELKVNKSSYYNALIRPDDGIFEIIADTEVDIVYLAGIYIDDQVDPADTTKSVAIPFSQYLGKRTVDHPQLGILGTRPLDDAFPTRGKVNEHFAALVNQVAGNRTGSNWLNAGYFMRNGFLYSDGSLEQAIDAGAYLSVVASDVFIVDSDLGQYVESAAALYAGTVASLKPQNPATYKPVPGIRGMPYTFSRTQLDTMNGGIGQNLNEGVEGGAAYVTVHRQETRGILFTRDVTCARRDSDFKDLQLIRIVNSVHKNLKDIAFPFLGRASDIPTLQSLETQVKSFLDGMHDADVILGKEGQGYVVDIKSGKNDPVNRMLGIIDIDIMIRPAFQIKIIRVKVRVQN